MGLFDFLFGSDNDNCGHCNGSGTMDKGVQTVYCEWCNGSGKQSDVMSDEKDWEGNLKYQRDVDQEREDLKKYY